MQILWNFPNGDVYFNLVKNSLNGKMGQLTRDNFSEEFLAALDEGYPDSAGKTPLPDQMK